MGPKEEKNNQPPIADVTPTLDVASFGQQLENATEPTSTKHWNSEFTFDYNADVSKLSTGDLIAALANEDQTVRRQSVSTLSQRNEPAVVEALIKCASDPENSIATKEIALDALSSLGSREAVEAIAAFIDHEHSALSSTAIAALASHAMAGDIDLSSILDTVRDSYAKRAPGEVAMLHRLTLEGLGWHPDRDVALDGGSMFEHSKRHAAHTAQSAPETSVQESRDQFSRPSDVTEERLNTTLPWSPTDDIILRRDDQGNIETNVAWSVYGGENGFYWGWRDSGNKELALNILNQVVPPGDDNLPAVELQSPYWDQSHVNRASATAVKHQYAFRDTFLVGNDLGNNLTFSPDNIRKWIAEQERNANA